LNGLDDVKAFALNDRIDVLVNNAGISMRGSCQATPLDIHRRVFEVNYFGQVAITRGLLDLIPEDGAILVIGSIQGRIAVPFRSAYSASKHALQAFFDSLRGENRDLHILMVSAGYIDTELGTRALRSSNEEETKRSDAMNVDDAARDIVEALIHRQTDLILAPIGSKMGIFLRWFAPDLVYWIMRRRAQKEEKMNMKKKEKDEEEKINMKKREKGD